LDGIDDTPKLDQEAIAHGFNQTTAMVGDGGSYDLIELSVKTRARPRFIGACEPAIADHVGSEYRRKPSLDAFFSHADSPMHVCVQNSMSCRRTSPWKSNNRRGS
jgi:hypothetical protein